MNEKIELPEGILELDTKYPDIGGLDRDNRDYEADFEMHYVERFGWVIPTLLISKARKYSGGVNRTYAISVKGQLCRVGMGPHVKKTIRIYGRKNRREALQKFLDLRAKGAEGANDARDRISTRRLQGSLRRSSWGF